MEKAGTWRRRSLRRRRLRSCERRPVFRKARVSGAANGQRRKEGARIRNAKSKCVSIINGQLSVRFAGHARMRVEDCDLGHSLPAVSENGAQWSAELEREGEGRYVRSGDERPCATIDTGWGGQARVSRSGSFKRKEGRRRRTAVGNVARDWINAKAVISRYISVNCEIGTEALCQHWSNRGAKRAEGNTPSPCPLVLHMTSRKHEHELSTWTGVEWNLRRREKHMVLCFPPVHPPAWSPPYAPGSLPPAAVMRTIELVVEGYVLSD
jgi:hypothetical protein